MVSGNGHIIHGTPVAVDLWNSSSRKQAKLFFLTHFHADHYSGLSRTWDREIYASPITIQLVKHKLKVNPGLLKPLEVGEDHIIPYDCGQNTICVRLIDANHCPGAVMFLFQGVFGSILYTGDFRYDKDFWNTVDLPPIDILYLDNTYCSPRCIFPSQSDAANMVMDDLAKCMKMSERVVIGMDPLGKEDLLILIHEEFDTKIYFDDAYLLVLKILKLDHIATQDENATKIFVVPTNKVNTSNLQQWRAVKDTCVLLPTARFSGLDVHHNAHIHVIEYSLHSSFQELQEFVKLVQPCKIYPIVPACRRGPFGADLSSRADMSVFTPFLDTS